MNQGHRSNKQSDVMCFDLALDVTMVTDRFASSSLFQEEEPQLAGSSRVACSRRLGVLGGAVISGLRPCSANSVELGASELRRPVSPAMSMNLRVRGNHAASACSTACSFSTTGTAESLVSTEAPSACMNDAMSSSASFGASASGGEFAAGLRRTLGINRRRAAMVGTVFHEWDQDGSGGVSKEEFAHAMQRLCPTLTSQERAEVFAIADANGDGFIEYAEFVQWLVGGTVSRKFGNRD